MRISQLDLLAYGKFTERRLAFPRSTHDFHIIIGPNEAGKSTVRRAITELLFGMERQSPLGFMHPQSDLRISGALEAESTKLAFVRTKQQKSLRSMSDELLPDGYLDSVMGALSQEVFEQLHCLDHEHLLTGGQGIVDPRNSVSQILFQAASGLDTFSSVRETLGQRATELFATRGRNSEYMKAADRHAAAQKTLKDVQVRTKEWVVARDALNDANEAIDTERKNRRELELQRTSWERSRRLAGLVDRLTRQQQDLNDIGETNIFPPNAKETLSAGISAMNAAAVIVEARENDVRDRQLQLDGIAVEALVLARAGDIERIGQLCGVYANHPRDLLLRRAEVNQWLDDVLKQSADFGWGDSEEEVRRLVPPEKVLGAIEALLKGRGAIFADERAAQSAYDERHASLEELERRVAESFDLTADPQLARALALALPYKPIEARQRTQDGALTLAQAAAERALAGLGKPEITDGSLRSMNLPSLERVTNLQANRKEIAQQADLARSLLAQNNERAESLRLQVSQFERSHKIVTVAEVSAARGVRDRNWSAVKSGAVSIPDGASQLEIAIRLADELVDTRTVSAADGATLQGLRDQLETANEAGRRHSRTVEDKELALREFDGRWADAATGMGLEGIELDDVPEWLSKRETALNTADAYAQRKHDYEHDRDTAAQARNDLAAAMTSIGLAVAESSGLDVLCAVAEEHIKTVERTRVRRESLEQQLREEQSIFRLAQKTKLKKTTAVEEWNARWIGEIEKAHLVGMGHDVADVEAAIEAAALIRQRLEKIDSHRSERIEAMEADLEALKSESLALALMIAPELSRSSPRDISGVLTTRLEEAKRQSNRKTQAQEFLDAAKRQLAEATSNVGQARRSLEPILKAAGVEDPLLALPAVEKSLRKVELADSISATLKLIEHGSDGLTVEQVGVEIASHPAHEAPARLMALQDKSEDSEKRLTHLAQAQLAATQKFEAINGGDRAAVAESQKYEAIAEMSEASEEYLQLATASSLLKWAVDRYRDRKQGPLLQRASVVFKNLTLGSFEKLRIDYDQTPPVLLAYRLSNQCVKVSGLSDGTRDQLFLALRIAALELQAVQASPVPFVADDLFINFDDKRSEAGLQALYALSTKTQVLFLSHQEYLLPIVQTMFPDVNIIALEV